MSEFPDLVSVSVVVDERLVGLDVGPSSWRTHQFSGIEAVPRVLHPAFADGGQIEELPLLDYVRHAYARRLREWKTEVPYRRGGKRGRETVLRSVRIEVSYKVGTRSRRALAADN